MPVETRLKCLAENQSSLPQTPRSAVDLMSNLKERKNGAKISFTAEFVVLHLRKQG